jgi:hypothetical protein
MTEGQQLICIAKEIWHVGFGPAKDEIVTFKCVHPWDDDFIVLKEYDREKAGYHRKFFAPLMDISELTEILESVPQHESV